MIKGKLPHPFQTIALAVTFNPSLPFLVAEMKRLCKLHNSVALFIHAGKKTSEHHRELSALLTDNGFHDGNARIYWESGEVVQSILRICKHEVVDLLLAGASDRENFSLPAGKTVKELALKAKCSVLVYSGTNPIHKITVNGIEHNKTELTISTALYFAEKEKITSVDVVEDSENEETAEGNVLQKGSYSKRETKDKSDVKLSFFTLASQDCTTLSEYAFKKQTDLLVTYSSDHRLLIFDRISGVNSIEALIKSLPCNLLIIHSRLTE